MNEPEKKERKPWQCHLSERDWAIVFFAWDNACPLAEAVLKYAEFEKMADGAGHYGHCTNEPEACFKCILEDAVEQGRELAAAWYKERPITDDLKYL